MGKGKNFVKFFPFPIPLPFSKLWVEGEIKVLLLPYIVTL